MKVNVRSVVRLRRLTGKGRIELRCDKCGGGVYLPITNHNMRLVAEKPRLVCGHCAPGGPVFYDR